MCTYYVVWPKYGTLIRMFQSNLSTIILVAAISD